MSSVLPFPGDRRGSALRVGVPLDDGLDPGRLSSGSTGKVGSTIVNPPVSSSEARVAALSLDPGRPKTCLIGAPWAVSSSGGLVNGTMRVRLSSLDGLEGSAGRCARFRGDGRLGTVSDLALLRIDEFTVTPGRAGVRPTGRAALLAFDGLVWGLMVGVDFAGGFLAE